MFSHQQANVIQYQFTCSGTLVTEHQSMTSLAKLC